jgi:hypothetical protein
MKAVRAVPGVTSPVDAPLQPPRLALDVVGLLGASGAVHKRDPVMIHGPTNERGERLEVIVQPGRRTARSARSLINAPAAVSTAAQPSSASPHLINAPAA